MRRLPKRHVFPGGYFVEIVVSENDHSGESLASDDCAACYETVSIGHGRITLHPNRTPRQQWRDLAHELLHALVDAQHHIERKVAP